MRQEMNNFNPVLASGNVLLFKIPVKIGFLESGMGLWPCEQTAEME